MPFVRSDQKHSAFDTMGVGVENVLKTWLEHVDKKALDQEKYFINSDGTVDLEFGTILKASRSGHPTEFYINVGRHASNPQFKELDPEFVRKHTGNVSNKQRFIIRLTELWNLLMEHSKSYTVTVDGLMDEIDEEFGEEFGNRKKTVFFKSNRILRKIFKEKDAGRQNSLKLLFDVVNRRMNEEFSRGGDPLDTMDVGANSPNVKFRFSELSKGAKEWAIDHAASKGILYPEPEIIVDDDYLLEPDHKEMDEIFGKDHHLRFTSPMIGNTRKIEFDIERGFIDISSTIDIRDHDMFWKWLGVPEEALDNVYDWHVKSRPMGRYMASGNVLEFEPYEDEFTAKEEKIFQAASDKFYEHSQNVLKRIESAYDWYASDEGFSEEADAKDWVFNVKGERIMEAFTRGEGAFKTMGVGVDAAVKKWMEEIKAMNMWRVNSSTKYEIDDQGYITSDSWYFIKGLIEKFKYNHTEYDDFINIDVSNHLAKEIDEIRKWKTVDIRRYVNERNLDNYNRMYYDFLMLRDLFDRNRKGEDKGKIDAAIDAKMREISETYGEKAFKSEAAEKTFGKDRARLKMWKARMERSEEKMAEEEVYNTYVFVANTHETEKVIDGETYYKKSIGVENMLKIDNYSLEDMQMIAMMKMRASVQHDAHGPYAVKIPKFMADKDNYYDDDLTPEIRSYIEKHKFSV